MTTIHVADATLRQIDWLVTRCEDIIIIGQPAHLPFVAEWLVMHDAGDFNYSTNPAAAWPIIDREKIDTHFTEEGWYANMYDRMKDGTPGYAGDTFLCGGDGETGLIAAMRCYVASKLGDTVEVPEELL